MNLALISREYPPFVGGGIGTYTRQFADALTRAGHRALVITTASDGREHRETRGSLTVVRLPFIRDGDWSRPDPAIATPEVLAAFRTFHPVSAFAMSVAEALPRLADEFAIDAIEAPDTGALAWFALNRRRAGRTWGRAPLITLVHSPSAWIDAANRATPAPADSAVHLARMEEDSARWSDALVSPSKALADWASAHWALAAGAPAVIPYPLGHLEPVARESLARSAPDSRPADVLYAGRLEARKGVDTLLEAWALSRGSAALHLVGEDMPQTGGGRFGEQALARLPAAARERVTCRGRLDPAAVTDARAHAAIAVIPSPIDNLPYSCLEAMAAGQVVVAAAAGGMAELIRDGTDGLLFTPGDIQSCAAALSRALAMSASDRDALGRAAAARVLDICGNDRVVAARLDHARGVLARPPKPAPAQLAHDLVCINGSYAPESALRLLALAASQPDIDFAHGWVRAPGNGPVIPFTTPSGASLSGPPRPLGPLMARRGALTRVAGLATDPPAEAPWAHARAPDTWSIARALSASGFQGCVVPDCVIALPARA